MKTYVSYVVQDEKGQIHKAEVVNSSNPPYSYSSHPQVADVMQWAE